MAEKITKCSYCGNIFDIDEFKSHGCFGTYDENLHALFIDGSQMVMMIDDNKEQNNENLEELQEAEVDSSAIDIDEEPLNLKKPNQEYQSHSAPTLEPDSYTRSLPTLFRPPTPPSSESSNFSRSPTPSLSGFSNWVRSLVDSSNSSSSDLVQPSTSARSDNWNEVIQLLVETMRQNTIMMTNADYAFATLITERMKMLPFKKKFLLQTKMEEIVNNAVREHLSNKTQQEE